MKDISKLHFITQHLPELTHAQQAELACKGGADWVQVRVKNTAINEWEKIAKETLNVCHRCNSKLIVNDNVEIAKNINADGLHLGKTDTDPVLAREIVGDKMIIGGTANTWEDIQRLHKARVDYIGLGPFRFTTTKDNLSPILGLEGYKEIIKKCRLEGINIPIIAIGGIELNDIQSILNVGIHGIAVSSLIIKNNQPESITKNVLNEIDSSLTHI